jgi:hypothetical protein
MGLNQFGKLKILAAADLNLYVTISLAMPYTLRLFISYSDACPFCCAWSLHGLLPYSLLVQLQH